MQKLFGAICIFVGCMGYGLSYMEKMKQRIAYAAMWENIMLMFSEEIAFKKQSLALTALEIGEKIKGIEGECFLRIYDRMVNQNQNGFADIWTDEWNTYCKKSVLTIKEKKLIEEVKNLTGFNDEKVQIKMIDELQKKWMDLRLEWIKEQQERKKIVWTLSACSGLILILILI